MKQGIVIVVGTTPDYINRLFFSYPHPVAFLVNNRHRHSHFLNDVPEDALIFSGFDNFERTLRDINFYLSARKQSPQGIACFDCESLITAARLAAALKLKFPRWDCVSRSRNKFESRKFWRAAGIATPAAVLASDLKSCLEFFYLHEDVVIKPISGSGGELVFRCQKESEVKETVEILQRELGGRRTNPLFQPTGGAEIFDPCETWIVEEFVSGDEFSCDFIFNHDRISFIRETGKVKARDKTFGSVLAYTLPPEYPPGFSRDSLAAVLKAAVVTLGYDSGYFMVDYIVQNGAYVILEITPRPGGDSLPDLVQVATGRDVLKCYLDFTAGRLPEDIKPPAVNGYFASLNLYAPCEGRVAKLDASRISELPFVKKVFLKKGVDDVITLPPRDYDNRLLGFCVAAIEKDTDIFQLSMQIERALDVTICASDAVLKCEPSLPEIALSQGDRGVLNA